MELLLVVLTVCAIPVIVAAAAALFAVRNLRRANRVSPRMPTTGPVTWLLLPDRPARLHRRLRRAVAMVRAAAQLDAGAGPGRRITPSAVAELGADLEQRACVIDAQLVVAARATGAGRRRMVQSLD